jgi:tetratricopeptide (TPR) repeat protein
MEETYARTISQALELSLAGKHEEALAELEQALQGADGDGELHLLRNCGIVAEQAGDWARAVQYGERALSLGDDPYLRHFLSRAFEKLGRSDLAKEHLDHAVGIALRENDMRMIAALVRLGHIRPDH